MSEFRRTLLSQSNTKMVFDDAEVESVLLSKMSHKNDGYITTREFKRLQSVGDSWFQENGNVTSFMELGKSGVTYVDKRAFNEASNLLHIDLHKIQNTSMAYAFLDIGARFLNFSDYVGGSSFPDCINQLMLNYSNAIERVVDFGRKIKYLDSTTFNSCKYTNCIIRSMSVPNLVRHNNLTTEMKNYKPLRMFVPKGMADIYIADTYYSIWSDRTYEIGGEKWTEVFGESDEYADIKMYEPEHYDLFKSQYERA